MAKRGIVQPAAVRERRTRPADAFAAYSCWFPFCHGSQGSEPNTSPPPLLAWGCAVGRKVAIEPIRGLRSSNTVDFDVCSSISLGATSIIARVFLGQQHGKLCNVLCARPHAVIFARPPPRLTHPFSPLSPPESYPSTHRHTAESHGVRESHAWLRRGVASTGSSRIPRPLLPTWTSDASPSATRVRVLSCSGSRPAQISPTAGLSPAKRS